MKQPSAWELAADDIISVAMVAAKDVDKARFEIGLKPEHMPTPAHRAALKAIYDLRDEKAVLHDTVVLDKAGGVISVEWLAQRSMLYDYTRANETYYQNAKICIRHANRQKQIMALQGAVAQLAKGANIDMVIASLISDFTIGAGDSITGETAGEHGREFRAYMDAEPEPFLSTGIPWLDQLTGGISPDGRMWWIGGAYKSRKTTLALNIMLSLLMANDAVSCAMLNKEVNRRYNNAALVAMLTVGYLKAQGLYRPGQQLVSADNLYRAQTQYRRWDAQTVKAVDWAIECYWKFDKRLRLYSAEEEKGSLLDLGSIERTIRRDMAMYGGRVFLIDYLQLFQDKPAKSDQKIYDRVANLSMGLQSIAVRNNVTVIVLAQLNEETIKGGDDGYSPGVKGGGDPAQTANYFLITKYKQGEWADNDRKLQVKMQLSRHGMGGKDVATALDIDAASGLLLDCTWISKIR